MKTLKAALIVLTIFTALSVSSGKYEALESMATHITLAQAIQDPGLVWAMYDQLDDNFLEGEFMTTYTATVNYNEHAYLITGSYTEWVLFFLMDL